MVPACAGSQTYRGCEEYPHRCRCDSVRSWVEVRRKMTNFLSVERCAECHSIHPTEYDFIQQKNVGHVLGCGYILHKVTFLIVSIHKLCLV